MARGGERLQHAGIAVAAIGLGLFVGALLGAIAGAGIGLIVCGTAAVAFGIVKERAEVTDGARPPAT